MIPFRISVRACGPSNHFCALPAVSARFRLEGRFKAIPTEIAAANLFAAEIL